jgi:hypothetical protein
VIECASAGILQRRVTQRQEFYFAMTAVEASGDEMKGAVKETGNARRGIIKCPRQDLNLRPPA